MPLFLIYLIAVMFMTWTGTAFGQNVPTGYTIPDTTLSTDKHFGVLVPKSDDEDTLTNPQNKIVEVATGHVIGAIKGETAFDRMNNEEIVPTLWSADDSMVLWQVDDKWGFETEILIKLENGKIESQVDVLSLLQQEILKRTRQAVPQKYAAVKEENKDDGSWYKDGFTVDCVLNSPAGPLKFPVQYHVYLTANPKGIDGATNVDSRMSGVVNQDGTIKVDDFHLGTDPAARNW
jgi:hypothetical protein